MRTDQRSFWRTLPGILTGIAAILVAIGGLVTAYTQFAGGSPGKAPVTPPAMGPAVPTTTAPPGSAAPPTSPSSPRAPAEPDIWGHNLVRNGDAEARCLSSVTQASIPNWIS